MMKIHPKSLRAPDAVQQRWELAAWQDSYSVSNEAIDGDHRRLFELYNELVAAVNRGDADTLIQDVLSELLDYTDYHFDREEAIMRQSSYPEYAAHKAVHDSFVQQLHDVNNHMDAGGEMGAFVLEFLGGWLTGHILGTDMKLGLFLQEQQHGRPA